MGTIDESMQFTYKCGWHVLFILMSKMKVKQQSCMAQILSFINNMSNFFTKLDNSFLML